MIHRKLRMNSTNLSEESDAYSDGDDHVDVESGVEDSSPCNGIRHISDRLRGDAENNTKCVLHESRLHPTENLFKPNVFSRSPESVTTKPVTRPSFLITDILSDTKRDSETDSSVPNTPCTPTNILDINRSAALLAQRHPSVIQSPTTDRSDSPCSDEESREGTPSSLSDEQHGLSSKSKKPRKARTAFTDHQLNSLEKNFERQKYLSVQDRMELAAKMGLSDTQVKTWYQNRRTKWKRQTAVGLELLAEAGNYATVQRMMQSSPYWSSYPTAPSHNSGLIDSLYYRQGVSPISSHRHMLSRMYLQGMSHIS